MAAFSDDASLLRVGSLVYASSADGQYQLLPHPLAVEEYRPRYIEDIAATRNVTVLARRSGPIAVKPQSSESQSAQPVADDVDDDGDDWASDDGHVSADSEDEAYESWSECSSEEEYEAQSDSESIVSAPDDDTNSVSDGSAWEEDHDPKPQDSDEENDEDIEAIVSENDAVDDAESSDASDIDPEKYAFYDWQSDDEEEAIMPTHKQRDSEDAASLDVYTPSGRVFHLIPNEASYLFDSAPVLHATEPLAVWPLDDSTLLFADYRENTYFTKAVGASGNSGTPLFMLIWGKILSPSNE